MKASPKFLAVEDRQEYENSDADHGNADRELDETVERAFLISGIHCAMLMFSHDHILIGYSVVTGPVN